MVEVCLCTVGFLAPSALIKELVLFFASLFFTFFSCVCVWRLCIWPPRERHRMELDLPAKEYRKHGQGCPHVCLIPSRSWHWRSWVRLLINVSFLSFSFSFFRINISRGAPTECRSGACGGGGAGRVAASRDQITLPKCLGDKRTRHQPYGSGNKHRL